MCLLAHAKMRLNTIILTSILIGQSLGALNETGFGVNTLDLLVPPSASPSQSMMPTAPTMAPTDSPVPSPSPSAIPTGNPTGTPMPTRKPTMSPTDSPVPSPSPTTVPSAAPSGSPSATPSAKPSSSPSRSPSSVPSSSPSALPSASPSNSPSAQPSISSAPSANPSESPTTMPSSSPSESPSAAPTVSSAPSASPSVSSAPSWTPSALPSLSPTPESMEMSALVSVNLESLLTSMSDDVMDVFEAQTKEFIQLELPPNDEMGVAVDVMSVSVVEQSIVTPGGNQTNSRRRRRFLQEEGLRVRMNVTGVVSPGSPPDDFDFAQVVSIGFAKNYLVYVYRLSSADPFFNPLLGDGVTARSSGPEDEDGGNGSGGATAGIVVGCLVALAIAGVAAFFAFKARTRSSSSFQKPVVDSISGSNLGLEQTSSRDLSISSPTSPSSLESGRQLGITRNVSMSSSVASSPTSSIHSERILGIRAHAISPNNVETLLISPNEKPTTIQLEGGAGPPQNNDEASLDGKLTKEVMMSLGATRNASRGAPVSQSDFAMLDDQSGQFTQFAATQSGGPCCAALGDMGGLLGARGMDSGEEEQYKERMSSESRPAVKSGLYDVFAPPGPLGIVVDTTKDGPVIHSLKYTSALLGLVGSGDLIVGLDDEDTRSMTAATLTRMMAKRSHQKERKITLLAMGR